MVHVGDRVLLGAGGQSVFEIGEDGYALVESVADAPGRNPFAARAQDLVTVPAMA